MKIIIIDDEAPARELIRHYLQEYPDFEITAEADNGFSAMKIIREQNPLTSTIRHPNSISIF